MYHGVAPWLPPIYDGHDISVEVAERIAIEDARCLRE